MVRYSLCPIGTEKWSMARAASSWYVVNDSELWKWFLFCLGVGTTFEWGKENQRSVKLPPLPFSSFWGFEMSTLDWGSLLLLCLMRPLLSRSSAISSESVAIFAIFLTKEFTSAKGHELFSFILVFCFHCVFDGLRYTNCCPRVHDSTRMNAASSSILWTVSGEWVFPFYF